MEWSRDVIGKVNIFQSIIFFYKLTGPRFEPQQTFHSRDKRATIFDRVYTSC